MIALALAPLIVGMIPTAGFMVRVMVALAAAFRLTEIGKVSEGYVASIKLKVTAPVRQPVL